MTEWYETSEGKQQLLDIINRGFIFDKEGNAYCRECKNETVACVCILENEDK